MLSDVAGCIGNVAAPHPPKWIIVLVPELANGEGSGAGFEHEGAENDVLKVVVVQELREPPVTVRVV